MGMKMHKSGASAADLNRSDRHARGNKNKRASRPGRSSTDNTPASETKPGQDNLKMAHNNPRTVLSGFKLIENNRGPSYKYGPNPA